METKLFIRKVLLISNCPVKNVEGVTIIHGVGRIL